MKFTYITTAVLGMSLSACDSAPSEESPVNPPVVCETPADDGTCREYEEVVSEEAVEDGQVNADPDAVSSDAN